MTLRFKLANWRGKRPQDWHVEIWADMSKDRSCGESRSDWQKIRTIGLATLVRALGDLATRRADSVDL